MGAKWKKGQTELFDGHPVENYRVKFTGSFDADEVQSENMSYDDHVCLVVMARVSDAKIGGDKDGELFRENALRVMRAVQISPELAERTLQAHSQGTGTPMLPLHDVSGLVDDDDDDDDDDEDDDDEPFVASVSPLSSAAQIKGTSDDALRRFLEQG